MVFCWWTLLGVLVGLVAAGGVAVRHGACVDRDQLDVGLCLWLSVGFRGFGEVGRRRAFGFLLGGLVWFGFGWPFGRLLLGRLFLGGCFYSAGWLLRGSLDWGFLG